MNYKIYGLRILGNEQIQYIGVTKLTLEKRMYYHLYEKQKSKKRNWIKSAIFNNKNIEIVLLEDGLKEKEAFCKEIQYIKLFKSFGANLKNLTNGGENPPNTKGIKRDKEFCEKISNAKKGVPNHKLTGLGNHKSKCVAQYHKKTNELLGVFPSILSASKFTNISNSSILKSIKKERLGAGGYIWKQIKKEDYARLSKKTRPIHKFNHDLGKKQIIAIFSNGDIKEYPSIWGAYKDTKINRTLIRACIYNKQKSTKGVKFILKNE